ncbi:dihydrofolate reductase [Streptomyces fuscigenes]|nr:dihydrofolate reductase [Streptomyces fuscigenes]
MAWIPFTAAETGELPAGVRHEFWDGTDAFPSDPASVSFYVPPPVPDAAVVTRPLPYMRALEVLHPLSSGVEQYLPHLGGLPSDLVVCNAQGLHSAATAELALTLILSSLRGMGGFFESGRRARWEFRPSSTLVGKTVLIAGHGSVGSALERYLIPFGCEILRVARRRRRDARGTVHAAEDLPLLLPLADVVVLTLPHTRETHHLMDTETLEGMKDGSLLVNMSRGGVVDTDALLKIVESGRITAALDVTDPEPLPDGHPLWTLPGVVVTPHAGAFTSAFRPALAAFVREQLARWTRGQPLHNVVDRSSGVLEA